MAGLQHDLVQRIVNVHWGGGEVYVIIGATRTDYATSNHDSVKILATRSQLIAEGGFDPVAGTLIESPSNAGAGFIQVSLTSSTPVGMGTVWVIVCPKTNEVRETWFDYVLALSGADEGLIDANGLPTGPFLWIARTLSGSPTVMLFKIRNESHLIAPEEDQKDRDVMVQAYPTSGNNTWPYGDVEVSGWSVVAYRLDKKEGVGQIYSGSQPEWTSDYILAFEGVHVGPGLKFGKDPPKIASDEPI